MASWRSGCIDGKSYLSYQGWWGWLAGAAGGLGHDRRARWTGRASTPDKTGGHDRAAGAGQVRDVSARRRLQSAETEILDFQILVDPVLRPFPTDTGFLHATKRCDLGRNQAGVDTDDPVFERLRHAPDAADVATVKIRREPI